MEDVSRFLPSHAFSAAAIPCSEEKKTNAPRTRSRGYPDDYDDCYDGCSDNSSRDSYDILNVEIQQFADELHYDYTSHSSVGNDSPLDMRAVLSSSPLPDPLSDTSYFMSPISDTDEATKIWSAVDSTDAVATGVEPPVNNVYSSIDRWRRTPHDMVDGNVPSNFCWTNFNKSSVKRFPALGPDVKASREKTYMAPSPSVNSLLRGEAVSPRSYYMSSSGAKAAEFCRDVWDLSSSPSEVSTSDVSWPCDGDEYDMAMEYVDTRGYRATNSARAIYDEICEL